MSKTILITGGAGFIGSNFAEYISRHYPDYRILVLDLLTYAGSMDNLPPTMREAGSPHSFWYGNVCNADLVTELVAQSDMVVHFAAETHVTRSIYDNLVFFQTDVLGTHTIANAVLKNRQRVSRFIHISTSEVYGTAEAAAMDEDHPLKPMSPYASAKTGADRLVYSYWATYRIPAVIVRPFNNYGPRQHLEKVTPRFVTSARLNEPLNVHGDGVAARDFVHVSDTCRAIDLVMHAPDDLVVGEVFNVASGQDRSILSIAEDVVRLTGADPGLIHFRGDRPGQVIRHTGDWSKISRVLGWQPRIGWEEGLQSTIDWYLANQPWWEKQMWMRSIPITNADGKVEEH
jgi:dTDP-glucose 4,6-dehydratase